MAPSSACAMLLAACASTLGLAMPVEAQSYKFKPVEAEQAMAQFARCVVGARARRLEAERFVRTPPGDPSWQRAGAALATDTCVPRTVPGRTEMRFQPDLLRAALFSAMYRQEFARSAPALLAEVPALTITEEFDGDDASIPESVFYMRTVGDCSARADSGGAHALLLTEIGSRAERPALDRMMSTLVKCVPAGQQLRFSRSMLRGVLAEALYKLRKAANGAAGARKATQTGEEFSSLFVPPVPAQGGELKDGRQIEDVQ